MKKLSLTFISTVIALTITAQSKPKEPQMTGFLMQDQLPQGMVYLPAPPDTSSIAYLNDFHRYQWGKSMRSTERGRQAVFDAYVQTDSILKGFSEAFGMLVTREQTPVTYDLIERVENDGSAGVRSVKRKYQRTRPYVQFHESTSVPWDEEELRRSGSYPSGHSARGWAIALVLSELNPAHQTEILKRGFDYGESRVIAGFHYQSDVDVARIAASAVVTRLHACPAFIKQLALAKKELEKFQHRKK